MGAGEDCLRVGVEIIPSFVLVPVVSTAVLSLDDLRGRRRDSDVAAPPPETRTAFLCQFLFFP